MKCPICKDISLLMTEKSGIQIDYCPECRGIWLDRGELEKIIENEHNNQEKDSKKGKTKTKKESFFSEILEIFSE